MSYGPRITGVEAVRQKMNRLPYKLENSITQNAMARGARFSIAAIRAELSSGAVRDTLKLLVRPNRKARAKAKTEKGQVTAAARLSQRELKRSIGLRKFPRSRMVNRKTIFHAVGPRSGFKITNIRSASKRIPLAATTVARMVEQGTVSTKPNAFTRRVLQMSQSPYQRAMLETARELIAKAGY